MAKKKEPVTAAVPDAASDVTPADLGDAAATTDAPALLALSPDDPAMADQESAAAEIARLRAENAKLRAASGLVDYAPGRRYLVKLKDAVSWVVEPAPGEHPYDAFRRVTGVLASVSQPEVSPTELPLGRA